MIAGTLHNRSRVVNRINPINRDHCLMRGLVWRVLALPRGVWGGGNTWRTLIGADNVALQNAPPWVGVKGRPGGYGCVDFDGSTQYGDAGDVTFLDGKSKCTFALWIRFDALALNKKFIHKVAGSNDRSFQFFEGFQVGTSDEFGIDIWDGATRRLVQSSNANMTTGVWYYLMGVWEGGSNVSLYKNGVLMSENPVVGGSPSTITDSSPAMGIARGIGGDTTEYVDGQMDDICIWDRDLSAQEAVQMYRESCQGNLNTLNWLRGPYSLPSAGATLSISVSADIGFDAEDLRDANYYRLPESTLGMSDAASRIAHGLRDPSDNLGLSDAVARIADSFRDLSDDLGLQDSALRIAHGLRDFSDSVGIQDSLQRVADALRNPTDNLGLSDAFVISLISGGPELTISVVDSLGLQDDFDRLANALRSIEENAGFQDTVARAGESFRQLTDNLALQDSVSRLANASRTISDSLGVQDTLTATTLAALVAGPGKWAAGEVYTPGFKEGEIYRPGFKEGEAYS